MTKLTDKEKKLIIADYLENQNYSEVARKYKRSVDTIRRVCLENVEVVNKLKEKKQENTKDILSYMEDEKENIQRVLKKLLNGIELKADNLDVSKDSIKDLATAYGIIIDKQFRIIELQQGFGNKEELSKVDELLAKINEEANNEVVK